MTGLVRVAQRPVQGFVPRDGRERAARRRRISCSSFFDPYVTLNHWRCVSELCGS